MLVVLIFVMAVASSEAHKNEIEATVEFFKIQNSPLKITAFICWDKDDVLYLSKLLNENSKYIAIQRDFTNIPIYTPSEHQFYFIDMNCINSNNILETANKTKLFQFPYRWLILDTNSHKRNFQNFDFYTNSRIYIIVKKEKALLHIKSIYKIDVQPILSNNVALWNGNTFDYYNRLSDGKNRSNLMGMNMTITTALTTNDSLNNLENLRDRLIDVPSKLNFILAGCIADMLNITRHFRFHNEWGSLNKTTGIYSGILGDLQLGTAELGGTVAFITSYRLPLIDYVGATTPTEIQFVYKAPPLSVVANVFTLPFNIWTWYACFVMLIVIFIVIYIIIKWEWNEEQFEKSIESKLGVLAPTAIDVVQMEIGAICQQGAEAEPKSGAGRIATFMVFLSLMSLYTSYCANIVALLQSTTNSINSLDDLLYSKIKLGAINITWVRFHLQKQTGLQKEIYLAKIAPVNKPPNFLSIEEGVEKMRNDFFGFFGETNSIYNEISDKYLESDKCGIMTIKFWTITYPYVPLRKNSYFKELVKIGYAKLFERGVQLRNFNRFYIKKPTCQNEGANFVSVSVNDCYFALLLFGGGTGFAIIIFTIEIILHKHYDKINKKITMTKYVK